MRRRFDFLRPNGRLKGLLAAIADAFATQVEMQAREAFPRAPTCQQLHNQCQISQSMRYRESSCSACTGTSCCIGTLDSQAAHLSANDHVRTSFPFA